MEREPLRPVQRRGEVWRKAFGLPSTAWQTFITDHLRKAGLKGGTFQEAQKAMKVGARKWRLIRQASNPIYPVDERVRNGMVRGAEIMAYVGPTEYDFFPHKAMLKHGAKVFLPSTGLLKRKQVPVLTRGKGYVFQVSPGELMYSPPKMTERLLAEA